ncbi:Nramp family divalent metal transporter [Dactylosporangium sp. CS-033363]|uniref:Nramp family divalent metal transporter n=1 Tax=Dactylosporangium sp. CS-033363 TaxID=3239935 RepID=UPI003D8F2EBC
MVPAVAAPGRWLPLLGPAFVASVAYVDPGNFASNFAGGAQYGYRFVWVIVMANLMAILVQYCAAKVGLATGRSLPEVCRDRFGRRTRIVLWLQGELVAMATDLAEFVGAAVGLNLLLGLPLLPAGLLTAVVAFAVLALQRGGHRRFEAAIAGLLLLVLGGFLFQVLAVGGQSAAGFAAGLVPRVAGADQATLVVAIVGATVMPHVVYLHSALFKDRPAPHGEEQRRRFLRANRLDVGLGLGAAGLVNLSMLCVAAALFFRPGLDLPGGLEDIHAFLGTAAGPAAAAAFAIALTASGLASASVGTYAGQVVMSGFLGLRINLLLRRAVTMVPALAVLALADDTATVLILSQVVLSFGIPFALVPLTLVTADRRLMGSMANRRRTTLLMWAVTAVVAALNAYLIGAFIR